MFNFLRKKKSAIVPLKSGIQMSFPTKEDIVEEPKRMYVIVRRDLSETYRMVQGAHALAEYAMVYPKQFAEWDNEYLIFLSVFNLISMRELLLEIKNECLDYSAFCEPDLDSQYTAVAMYLKPSEPILKDLPLA